MSEDQNPTIAAHSQKLEPGTLITMYTIDLAPLGVNQFWHFTPHADVTFRGITYNQVPVHAEGFEWAGQGAMPRPKIRIANANRAMSGVSAAFQDLVGATFIRMRTYAEFLDGQPNADPDAMYGVDIYTFEQKTAHDKIYMEWTLAAAMDQEGRQVPGRLVLRDLCLWRYRVWNKITEDFDYSKVQCPYVGSQSYDAHGNPTSAPNDNCGRRISDCKLRFGKNALPYGGFPGVSRMRS